MFQSWQTPQDVCFWYRSLLTTGCTAVCHACMVKSASAGLSYIALFSFARQQTKYGNHTSAQLLLTSPPVCCSPVQNIQNKIDAQRLQRSWSLSDRRQQLAQDEALSKHNADAKCNRTPLRCFWRSLYLPEQGMFCQAPADLHLGDKQEVRVKMPVLAIQLYRCHSYCSVLLCLCWQHMQFTQELTPYVLLRWQCVQYVSLRSHWPCVVQSEGVMHQQSVKFMPPSNSTDVCFTIELTLLQTQLPTTAHCTCRRQTVL